MRKRIYVTGNALVREDSVPLRIMERLQCSFPSVEFLELESTDDMPEEHALRIIDTVIGIDEVKIIKDVDKIVTGKVYSLHDFDLGYNLKLMKKAGKLRGVTIIGVPAHFDEERAYEGVTKALQSMLKPAIKQVL